MQRLTTIVFACVTLLMTLTLLAVMAHRQGWLDVPPAYDAARVAQARQAIHHLAAQWVQKDALARADGWTYTVDVGELLIAAALARDADTYQHLRAFCLAHLIQNDPSRPDTRDMVLWRYQPGSPPDASGTTEALRVARGLWYGGARFHRPQDRDLAHQILRAYLRHQTVEQGVWLIRNYYNFGTHAFATNSFTIDYDPDLLAEVGRATGDADLLQAATKSYAVVRSAVAPCGLIYDVIQPEVTTIIPDMPPVLGPNDIVQISNSASIVEHAAQGLPGVARPVLTFALRRQPDLHLFFLGRSGAEPFRRPCGPEGYTALLRLAVHLGDQAAVRRLAPYVADQALAFAAHPYAPKPFLISELWLALEVVSHGH